MPIDCDILALLRLHWNDVQDSLISAVDADFGVYDGRTFKADRWGSYLLSRQIPWPHHDSGSLDLSDNAFTEMSRTYPELAPIRELRHALSKLRLNDIGVGGDGRHRCMLSAFNSKTGRNQPSASRYIYGPAVWLRGLIQPKPGMALCYIDYEQQEFGIGAALSGDLAMQKAYLSGDPYLAFAVQAGAAPPTATKESHKVARDRFKVCALAVQYGMAETSLALKLNESTARSRELLRLHRDTYPAYWRWSDAIETTAMMTGTLTSAFGWAVHVGHDANPRSLRHFPLQANGAEMLRIACILGVERGVRICAPVHDALLIEAPEREIEKATAECQRAMRDASEIVLGGFALRTEAKTIRYPERYSDPRGEKMWNIVTALLLKRKSSQ